MPTIQSAAGIPAMKAIIAILENWDVTLGGKKPKIEPIWDEAMLRYTNTDSYILLQIDQEKPNSFSLMEGSAPDYTYQFLHNVNLTLDIRVQKDVDRFEQIIDYVMEKIKKNIRLLNHVQQYPLSITYDNALKNVWRATITIRIDRHEPTKTV